MKFSQVFTVINVDDYGDDNFIYYEKFIEYLLSKDSELRSNNVKRTLKGYKDGLKTYQGKTIVCVKSILRYIFQYSDSVKGCKLLADIVDLEISKNKTSHHQSSSLELYRLIAKTQFSKVSQSVSFEEDKIQTLIVEHKRQFNENEWMKICWFEKHFSSTIDASSHGYESVLDKKYKKFESLLAAKQLSDQWNKGNQSQIRENIQRQREADVLNKVVIWSTQKHSAYILDGDLLSLLQKYCSEAIQTVTSFDCDTSKCNNSVQVVVEISENQLEFSYDDLAKRLFYFAQRTHSLNIEHTYFISSSKIQQFVTDETISRFHLRDALQIGKFTDIVYRWSVTQDDNLLLCEASDNEECEQCYNDNRVKPLSLESFDIFEEWFLEVPMETQIMLETFLNKRYLHQSKMPEIYARQKLEKLYRLYESLLHIYNKDFCGIFQKANADSLLIEYKSVSSVFDITSVSGTTSCLRRAETKLKEKADDDLCYYNTYLKQHPLSYEATSGTRSQTSLRECHLILMLDNLVRLKFLSDPNPGETRSSQLCTLPITLQGLPVDSKITEAWHQSECDGTSTCICKMPIVLSKRDIDSTMLTKNELEDDVYTRFSRLMTWGHVRLWKQLPDEMFDHLENESLTERSENEEATLETSKEMDCREDGESDTSEDTDLIQLLEEMDEVNSEENNLMTAEEQSLSYDEEYVLSDLERSIEQLSVVDEVKHDKNPVAIQELLSLFGFKKFTVPPLLCRHPPPASGRDDDIFKIKEILDDTYTKLGYDADPQKAVNRILCGPDNKIGKCILNLMDMDPKYKSFLPEFPLLHLRKSKITVLFSAYKDAGIIQLLKYMREDDQDDWKKLASVQHIDVATRFVKRIAISLQLALLVVFARQLSPEDKEVFLSDMETSDPTQTSTSWSHEFEKFVQQGSKQNATFALHMDMLKHCTNVVAIALAERLGGPDGYNLLTAVIKDSLPFLFVNNASSYAPFCAKLLFHHFSSGHFHQCLKHTLFSTPFKNSTKNFACDTKRELDHIEALKGFRSGSNLATVTCRMSLIDSLNDCRDSENQATGRLDNDALGWGLSEVDENHILPTATLIVRQCALSIHDCDVPVNVYTKVPLLLPVAVLDACSYESGRYLLMRFLAREKLFGLTESDIPNSNNISGPKELVSRAKRSKGITIKRTVKSKVVRSKTERQMKEEKRQKQVAKETKLVDCLSSENNACQALLKPDSTKPKVVKSLGMQRALTSLVTHCLTANLHGDQNIGHYIRLNLNTIPTEIQSSMKICCVEFAGTKFKTAHVKSGDDYLKHTEAVLNKYIVNSNTAKLVICEEKYSFTPDDFKAGTREQRKGVSGGNIDHLKTDSTILTKHTFHKDALTKTEHGKRLISNYLAENITSISLRWNCQLIIDSELHKTSPCTCAGACGCQQFCTPVTRNFDKDNNSQEVVMLQDVHQMKGEAEMAIVDWVIFLQQGMEAGDSVVSIVTSGDIDAVYIQLHALCTKFDRDQSGKFRFPAYVILQKQKGKCDVYNITSILELLEKTFHDRFIGVKVAMGLCLGGNDFLPKFHHISHETILNLSIRSPHYRLKLFTIDEDSFKLNIEEYKDMIKDIYCPKRYKTSSLSFDQVRAATIWQKTEQKSDSQRRTTDPKKWLPPASALERLSELIDFQIKYLEGAGIHEAALPKFLSAKSLKKSTFGDIEYDLGPDCHFENIDELPKLSSHPTSTLKRVSDTTPQKGCRRKRILTSTPKSKH